MAQKIPAQKILTRKLSGDFMLSIGAIFFVGIFLFALPFFFAWKESYEPPQARLTPFTVTVDPKNKLIVENPDVEAILSGQGPLLSAAVGNLEGLFDDLSAVMAQSSIYASLASVGIPRFAVIYPGLRTEEVAAEFGDVLGWEKSIEAEFVALKKSAETELTEGAISPGLYTIRTGATSDEMHRVTDERFRSQILSRYSTSTADVVPLHDALIIASMIQRETADKEEMRVISGIIWNRIFSGMPLQLDATLQYAKANKKTTRQTDWWPIVYPRDKYISSPYNTYQNKGLPPAPISNPSVSAVIAALNPKKTDCVFYFHDDDGGFHCTETYAEHVAELKKYYGRGR